MRQRKRVDINGMVRDSKQDRVSCVLRGSSKRKPDQQASQSMKEREERSSVVTTVCDCGWKKPGLGEVQTFMFKDLEELESV